MTRKLALALNHFLANITVGLRAFHSIVWMKVPHMCVNILELISNFAFESWNTIEQCCKL